MAKKAKKVVVKEKRKNPKRCRTGIIAGSCLAAAVLVAVILAVSFGTEKKLDLSINGLPVTAEEYRRMLNSQTYQVQQDISEEYKIQTGAGFWTREESGVLPYRILADQTVEALKEYRALYELAREQGYVDDISYGALLKRVETENTDRANKISMGEPVYGLSSFTVELFLEYEADAIRTRYCDGGDNPGMDISEETLRSAYEERREEYRRDDELSVSFVKIWYQQLALPEEETAGLKTKLEDLAAQDGSLYDLALADPALASYTQRWELSDATYRQASREIPDVLALTGDLEEGVRTAVTDENGTLYLVECTARADGGYTSYEDARSYLLKTMREAAFDQIVAQRADAANVTGNMESVYQFTKTAV